MGDEIIALRDKIIVKLDNTAEEKDIALILAKAKLGENDPLLATFYFQNNISPSDSEHAAMFFSLCQPLQDAWSYKILRRSAPKIYEREITELMSLYEVIASLVEKEGGDMDKRRMVLSIFTIIAENPTNKADLVLVTDDENKKAWDNYISKLKELLHKEPDSELYLQLPVASIAPYTVKIIKESDDHRHYDVRGK